MYYNTDLKLWIDIDNMSDWKIVDIKPDIQYIFDKLKQKYFFGDIKEPYGISFDENHAIVDGSAFKIFQRPKMILIAESVFIRPRIQQISVFLHILIHLYLNEASNDTIGINKHDENFRSIMHQLNRDLNATITTNHKFIYTPEEDDYRKQWWMCTGICQNYHPFKGLIRSKLVPNECMIFWKLHHEKCSGSFFHIFEIQKTNSLEEVHKKYVKSTCYMNPNRSDYSCKSTAKDQHVKLPIREKIDLTNECRSPVVRNMCEIVDLDESQYNSIDVSYAPHAENFKFKSIGSIGSCPFCKCLIRPSVLPSHFDVCLGFQSDVKYKPHFH